MSDFSIVLRGCVPSARLIGAVLQTSPKQGEQMLVRDVEYRELLTETWGTKKIPVLHTIATGDFLNNS